MANVCGHGEARQFPVDPMKRLVWVIVIIQEH